MELSEMVEKVMKRNYLKDMNEKLLNENMFFIKS